MAFWIMFSVSELLLRAVILGIFNKNMNLCVFKNNINYAESF